ncbi:MAG: 16S rRNA (cytosine(1402)-N(4))-methyltransferase RsmH [Granulosicoccaceae bacterium]|jgi:16S rRNA (cytosine1402-N4)-methyltransferase
MTYTHRPVLLDEALAALSLRPDGLYVDGTFGRGGHARAILQRLDENGRLLALDRDPHAIQVAQQLAEEDSRFTIKQGSFTTMQAQVENLGWTGKVDGILLDLGVSSPQLDDPSRGFSFQHDGPLDMRMDNTRGMTAAQWLGSASERDIATVLRDYGEERYAKRIARAIVAACKEQPITTTAELAAVVARANPSHEKHKHPATRTFQAIRIFINRELEEIKEVLQDSVDMLTSGGRLVVISFHSLEDRVVKRFMRDQARGDDLPRDLPVTDAQRNIRMQVIGKPVYASDAELAVNPRARSAVLRVAERC